MSALFLEEQVKMILAIGQRQLDSTDESARLQLQSEEENAVYDALVRNGMARTLACSYKPNGAPYDVIKCQLTSSGNKIYQAAEEDLHKGIELLQPYLPLQTG